MDQSAEIVRLLGEIRDMQAEGLDLQREQLAQYRKDVQRSFAISEASAERARRIYRLLMLFFLLASVPLVLTIMRMISN
ncbi:MAG: hypothetical protein WD229_01715 [Pirellulales bacterium]